MSRSDSMKRVFIALKVEPDENLKRIYSNFRSLLADEKITWVDTSCIHITLVFLGDIQDKIIKSAETALRELCAGFKEFSFNLKGTGVFKSLNDPRVIWIGIEQSDELMKLNQVVVNGLRNNGFILEDRSFKPHLTLGRIKYLKDIETLRHLLDKYKDTLILKIDVSEVILFESILKQTGPVYNPICRFHLI